MTKLNVVVCDDDPQSAQALSRRLDKFDFLSPNPLSPEELMAELKVLADRQQRSRSKGRARADQQAVRTKFDDADILVLDYDLIGMRQSGVITGEEAAYLVRCYSTCKVIVAVNQYFRSPTFDLTLRGHFESFADVNVSADDLGNRGLWDGDGKGFRPWYWPSLYTLVGQMAARSKQVSASNGSVLDLLGLPADIVNAMSADVLSPIFKSKRPMKVAEFLAAHGLRRADGQYAPSSDLIVAARLGKWVRTLLLSGQDIIVDAPHLIERCPSLVDGKRTMVNCNRATAIDKDHLGIDHRLLRKHEIMRHWVPTPTWNWTAIEKDVSLHSKIPELVEPWARQQLPYVFCEDVSKFRSRKDARFFVADLRSGYNRRAIEKMEGIDYRPELRLAM